MRLSDVPSGYKILAHGLFKKKDSADLFIGDTDKFQPYFILSRVFDDVWCMEISFDVFEVSTKKEWGRFIFSSSVDWLKEFYKEYEKRLIAEEERKSLWNQC